MNSCNIRKKTNRKACAVDECKDGNERDSCSIKEIPVIWHLILAVVIHLSSEVSQQ